MRWYQVCVTGNKVWLVVAVVAAAAVVGIPSYFGNGPGSVEDLVVVRVH